MCETGRQIDRHTHGETERERDRQTHRERERQTERVRERERETYTLDPQCLTIDVSALTDSTYSFWQYAICA